MYDYKPGYAGHDSMRARAEQAFGEEMRAAHHNSRRKTVERETHGHYKKGGHTKMHRLTKEQTDLHIPRKVKKTENMRRGGKTHYSFGGLLGQLGGLFGGLFGDKGRQVGSQVGQTLGGLNDEIADNVSRVIPFLKKGGRAESKKKHHAHDAKKHEGKKKHHYARGGNVMGHETSYEREMLGEHPSHKAPHFNYEAQMRGVKSVRKAAGGVAKIRHKEATKKGMPIKSRKAHRRYDEGGEVRAQVMPVEPMKPLNMRMKGPRMSEGVRVKYRAASPISLRNSSEMF